MPVWVIDTLKPKNGLDFPVVEAVDVAVEGYASLADAVTHFATQSAIDAINTALGTKANTSDVNTATASLQAQIDQIAQTAGTGTADTEIAQARVGADGTSYQTLKARLDASDAAIATKASQAELEDLKNELNGIANITSPLSTADVKAGYSFNAADELINTGNLTRAAVVNVPLLKEKTIINTNFQFALDITGDGKQEFISVDGEVWFSNGFIIPDGNNYNILFKRLDGEDITSDDIAEIKQSFKQIENLSYSKSEIDNSINAIDSELTTIENIVGYNIYPVDDAEIKIGYKIAADDTLYSDGKQDRASCIGINLVADKIFIDNQYQFALDLFGDGKQEFISIDDDVWFSNGFIVPESNKYNIMFKRLDNGNLSATDIANIKSTMSQSGANFYTKTEVDQKIDNIDKSNLYGKTITAIGDSFIDYHTQGLGNDLLSKIADGKDMTIYNYGLSSSSLAYDSNQTVPSVMDRYQTMIAEVSQADYVIVLAGHNDSNAQLHGGSPIPIGNDTDTVNTTFKGALNILCDALLTAYPNAGILFLTPFRRRDTELPYCTAMEEVCANYSIPVFNNYKKSGICFNNSAQDTLYDNGNMHLNALGNERVAKKYISILETL